MRSLRNLMYKILRFSGLPFLFREILQRKKVTIVMLHDPAPDMAARTFRFLASHYNIIALDDFLEARRTGDAGRLPNKALIITLDDGHIGNYRLLPVIKAMNIPVTIFLCAGIIDTRRQFWFQFEHPDLSKPALKQMTNREKLKALAKAGFRPELEWAEPRALNKNQIQEMAPYVNFQGHTTFHPCLPKCDGVEAFHEIAGCREILEQNFHLKINAMAYPNGDYSERDIDLIKQAGYTCAITVDYGFNTIHTDPYRLRRLSLDDTDNTDAIYVKASGAWTFLLNQVGNRRVTGLMDPVATQSAYHLSAS